MTSEKNRSLTPILMYQENGDYTVYVHDRKSPAGERIQHPEHMAHVANGLEERIARLEAEVRQLTDKLYDIEIAKAPSQREALPSTEVK